MHPFLDENSRQVVPRWRTSRLTMSLNELASSATPPDRALLQPELIDQKLEDWKRERSLSFATDLLASAIVAGEVSDAREAAEFVLSPAAAASEAAKTVASRVITPLSFDRTVLPIEDSQREQQRAAIRSARTRTRADMRNALAWVDLALAYASLGFRIKAEDSMEIALAMAPGNRFVLRSAARLFVHTRAFDRACWVLRSAPQVTTDPWLMAAEIAVSELSKSRSKLTKGGVRLVERAEFSPFSLSELASAVGTLELQSGNTRGARKLLMKSLAKPTDNSLAQASWVARTSHIISVNPALLNTPRSFEARAREHLQNSEWEMAFDAALEWTDDERFAAGPALLAANIASTLLDDFNEALAILRMATLANPTYWLLRNNAAFCLASLGRVTEAIAEFELVGFDETHDLRKPGVLLATSGLIKFRQGDVANGRTLYLAAIDFFAGHEHRNSRALAAVYLAREEVMAQTNETEIALRRASEFAAKADTPELPVLLDRIERLAAK